MKTVKDKCQEICDAIQARLSGLDKPINLHEQIADKDQRIAELEKEVKAWHEKFSAMWSAWHKLAIETKGAEAAASMADNLKHGK